VQFVYSEGIGLGADSIAKAQAHAKAEIDKIVTEL